MRSLNVKRLKSFLTFDLPVKYSYIYSCFRKTHEERLEIYARWPIEASRRQLINAYWNNAQGHYLLLLGFAYFAVLSYSGQWNTQYVLTSIVLGVLAYIPLYFLLYKPIFTGEFLPMLETCVAAYGGRERAWMEKCKQDQLTNRALVFFFYAFDKASKANYLTPSDKCADLLHRVFGSSSDGIKKALDLVFKKAKRAELGHRHLVEVSKSFEEAFAVLEIMKFSEDVRQLRAIGARIS